MSTSESPNTASGVLARPGARISYDIAGGGPEAQVVLSAHGMLSSRAQDDLLHLGFAAIAGADLELVRYDARGHGDSTGEPDGGSYAWAELAHDLLALADEVSPGARVDGIGASMGSGTLLSAAVQAPERFRRLVIVIAPTAWETRAAQVDNYRVMQEVVVEQGEAAFNELLAAAPMPAAFTAAGTGDVTLASQVQPGLLPSVLEGAGRSDLPPRDAIAALPHPALILAWRDDPTHPVSTAEALAELLPNAELHVADSLDEVDGWSARVREFLSR